MLFQNGKGGPGSPAKMVAMSGMKLSPEAVRGQIASAVGLIVQVMRLSDGKRRVMSVTEITGMEGQVVQMQEIFGFNRTHTSMFADWNGLVDKIWFIACLVARIPDAAMASDLASRYPNIVTGDGNIFCSEIARAAQCYVVASTEEQRNAGGYTLGQMPTFEGLVLSYGPGGGVTWSKRYSSDWAANGE